MEFILDLSPKIINQQKVLLDYQLASLLEIKTKSLNQIVKRNKMKFLNNHFQIKNYKNPSTHGGRRSAPYAFTIEACKIVVALIKPKKIEYREKAIEDFLTKDLRKLDSTLTLKQVQFKIGRSHRPDILAYDNKGLPVIVELQIGSLDRNHFYKSLEYRDLYYLNHGITPRVILLAESISENYKKIITIHNVKFIKINQTKVFSTSVKYFDTSLFLKRINNLFKEPN